MSTEKEIFVMSAQIYSVLGALPITMGVFIVFHWIVDKLISKYEEKIRKIVIHLLKCEPDSLAGNLLHTETFTNNAATLLSPLILLVASYVGSDIRIIADLQNGLRYSEMRTVSDPMVFKGLIVVYFNLFVVNTVTYALFVKNLIKSFDMSYYVCSYLSEFWTHCGLLMVFYGVDIYEIVLAPVYLFSIHCQVFMIVAIFVRIKLLNILESKMPSIVVYVLHSLFLLMEVYFCRLYGGAQTVQILAKPIMEPGSPIQRYSQIMEGVIIIAFLIISHTIIILLPVVKQLWSLLKMKFRNVWYDEKDLINGIVNQTRFEIRLKFEGPSDSRALIPIDSFEIISVKNNGTRTKLLHVKANNPEVVQANENGNNLEMKIMIEPQDSVMGFVTQLNEVLDDECKLIAMANVKLSNHLYSYKISEWSAREFTDYWMSITTQTVNLIKKKIVAGSYTFAKKLQEQATSLASKVENAEKALLKCSTKVTSLGKDLQKSCRAISNVLGVFGEVANNHGDSLSEALNNPEPYVPQTVREMAPGFTQRATSVFRAWSGTVRTVGKNVAAVCSTTQNGLATATHYAQKAQNVANGAHVQSENEGTSSRFISRCTGIFSAAANEGLAPEKAVDIVDGVQKCAGIVEGIGNVIADTHKNQCHTNGQQKLGSSKYMVEEECEDDDSDAEYILETTATNYAPSAPELPKGKEL